MTPLELEGRWLGHRSSQINMSRMIGHHPIFALGSALQHGSADVGLKSAELEREIPTNDWSSFGLLIFTDDPRRVGMNRPDSRFALDAVAVAPDFAHAAAHHCDAKLVTQTVAPLVCTMWPGSGGSRAACRPSTASAPLVHTCGSICVFLGSFAYGSSVLQPHWMSNSRLVGVSSFSLCSVLDQCCHEHRLITCSTFALFKPGVNNDKG